MTEGKRDQKARNSKHSSCRNPVARNEVQVLKRQRVLVLLIENGKNAFGMEMCQSGK